MENYFEAEDPIVNRLKEATGIKHVFTPFDLEGMQESSQPSPSLHVIYAGDVLGDAPAAKDKQFVGQRWMVVLAVRSAKAQLKDTTELRATAGQTIPLLLKALQGWAPVASMRPLGRVAGPPPGYSAAFAYFPFMFEGRITT